MKPGVRLSGNTINQPYSTLEIGNGGGGISASGGHSHRKLTFGTIGSVNIAQLLCLCSFDFY